MFFSIIIKCSWTNSQRKSATRKTLELNTNTSIEKHAHVLNFFKSLGFSDAQISKITAQRRQVLTADIGKTLKPKTEFLVDYGISRSFLLDLIAADPTILTRRPNSHLVPILRLLHTYLGSNEKVVAAVKHCSWLLSYGNKETMEQNLNLLASEGVPIKSIWKLISRQPRSITQNVNRMVHALKSAKQFGFRPVDPMFVNAISVLFSKSESTMYQRTEFVKNLLGLSEEEVKYVFKRDPQSFNYSEGKMKNVTNFFINTVRVDSSFLLPILYISRSPSVND